MPANTERTIELQKGTWYELGQPIFFHSTDGTPGTSRTNVKLLAADGFLTATFECLDDPFWRHNHYTRHNTDLWRQEVFEIFIAAGNDTPRRYLELEINPHNAFFAAWVDNLSGMGPENLTMLTHEEHGIRHEVSTGESEWSGTISIPLLLLGEENAPNYRVNFYRIVLRSEPGTHDWECSPDNCDFLCWNATMSGHEPAFHRPAYFGGLSVSN